MSLVPYDSSSSSSENEDEVKENRAIITISTFRKSYDTCKIKREKREVEKPNVLSPPKQIKQPLVPGVVLLRSKMTSKLKTVVRHKKENCNTTQAFGKSINIVPKVEEQVNVVTTHEILHLPVDATKKMKYQTSNVSKKKHHIMYLAQQAKINQEYLNEQWSEYKYKKQMSRLKYGF